MPKAANCGFFHFPQKWVKFCPKLRVFNFPQKWTKFGDVMLE